MEANPPRILAMAAAGVAMNAPPPPSPPLMIPPEFLRAVRLALDSVHATPYNPPSAHISTQFWPSSFLPKAIAAAYASISTSTPKQDRAYWYEKIALNFDPKNWRLHFRVSKVVYNYVLDAIIKHKSFRVADHITNPIDIGKQLAIFLYRVGSTRPGVARIAKLFEVSTGTVVNVTARVGHAILECLGHLIFLPKDGPHKKKMMAGFERRGYRGAVVILDCTGIGVVCPTVVTRAGQFTSRTAAARPLDRANP